MAQDTIASEVVSAAVGGAISASILYPLEVVKTKMQASNGGSSNKTTIQTAITNEESSSDDEDFPKQENNKKDPPQQQEQLSMIPFCKQLYEQQGASVFLRGIETSAFQSALEKSLYFFAYQALKQIHRFGTGGAKLDAFSNLLLGYAADWAHLPVTLPVDAWTTAIQTCPADKKEAPLAILLHMLSDKKVSFYKGMSAYTLLCLKPALQYTVFEQVKTAVVAKRQQKKLSASEAFLLGMVARAIATVVVFPFLRAKVLMQTQQKGGEDDGNSDSSANDTNTNTGNGVSNNMSMVALLSKIFSEQGWSGIFQGLGPELTRGVFSAALMLMIKERIGDTVKAMLSSKQKKKGTAQIYFIEDY